MKLHRMLLASAALLAAVATSTARADEAAFATKVKATADLLGFWSFEGNFNDQSGKNNNATVSGDASLVTFSEGVKGGQSAQIDNKTKTGQFLQVQSPIGSIFDTPKTTVITWAKITGPHATDDPNTTWSSLVDRNSLWYISMENKADRGGADGLDFVTRIYSPDSPTNAGTDQVRDENVFVRANEWHMFAFTYDGAVIVNYLDGKEVERKEFDEGIGPTADTPTDPPHNNYNLTWGAWQQRDDWFTGNFDDTAIFGRALSADEMKGIFDAMMQ
jgi:Concanavalin A-like lectin/glucanases superfamily